MLESLQPMQTDPVSVLEAAVSVKSIPMLKAGS